MPDKRTVTAVLAALLVAGALPGAGQVAIDSNTFSGLSARSIGPATMSGRIAGLDAVRDRSLTIYAGTASGGVWKSKDGGVTFDPVFDEHPQSIGAVAIDPGDPETVWVGTGESWTRNSVSIGAGVYKTTDGGETWQLKGLADSERIARIVVHPTESDTVYVCATGRLWSAGGERGLYRTEDGGETWEAVLTVDEDTGCSDVAIDPQDPTILYAGTWDFRRFPDYFRSGGPGSGLHKTTDGGETWRELTNGLPEGEKGRIAVAVAPSRPSRLYAVVEAEETALYRSDDLGESWTRVNDSFTVTARPFYFAYVVVDPTDFERVYKPGLFLGVSTDGGNSFSSFFTGGFGASVHSDHHALWIDPEDPQQLVLGTDGGVYVSHDRGGAFRFVGSLPVSQFYEVSYDLDWPYNVYGGLQDNGTWVGPSQGPGGIFNKHWDVVGFGDGFHAYRDPSEPDLLFVEFQGGQLLRHQLSTSEIKAIAPLAGEGDPEYRFNWNAPIHLSPATPGTIYYGAQFLFRSRDRGESWERISPDLTTDDPQRQRQKESGGLTIDNSTAEANTTIYSISESPENGEVIWVGTDDGLVQVTRDGGESWTDVTAGLPGLPPGLWVSHVEASPHDEATAHVTVDGHRSGDMSPYVFRTRDYGASWESITSDGIEGFAHVVVQDPVNPDLLFVGTELGLYLTLDGGRGWARFSSGLPKVPVRDVDVHSRDHDLIVGTHGRGIYILDDLTPLRNLTQETLESDLALLPARDSVMTLSGGLSWFNGDGEFVGQNSPQAASIFFYQKKRHIFGDLKIEIYDEEGEVLATVSAPKLRGLNRADWPMRLPPPKMPPATNLSPAFVGPRVPEGTYRFKLIKGKDSYEGEVRLVPDPRSPHSAEDRRVQQEVALDLYGMLEELTYVVDAMTELRDQARARAAELGERDRLAGRLEGYADRLEAFRTTLVSTSEAGWLSGDEKLREQLGNVYGAVSTYDGRPSQSQIDRAAVLGGELERAGARFTDLSSGDELAALNRQLAGKQLEPLAAPTREAWETEQTGSGAGVALGKSELATLPMRFAVMPVR